MFVGMKWEIGFEEYLECVKGAPSKLFLKFCLGTHELFEELGRYDKVGGSETVLIVGLVRNQLSTFFFGCASCDSQRLDFLDCFKMVLPPNAFEAFIHGSIFDKTVFCLGEKQGMLVSYEYSSWYNRVGDF